MPRLHESWALGAETCSSDKSFASVDPVEPCTWPSPDAPQTNNYQTWQNMHDAKTKQNLQRSTSNNQSWSAPSVDSVTVLDIASQDTSLSAQKAQRSEYWSTRCLRYKRSAPNRTSIEIVRSWNLSLIVEKTLASNPFVSNPWTARTSVLIQATDSWVPGTHRTAKTWSGLEISECESTCASIGAKKCCTLRATWHVFRHNQYQPWMKHFQTKQNLPSEARRTKHVLLHCEMRTSQYRIGRVRTKSPAVDTSELNLKGPKHLARKSQTTKRIKQIQYPKKTIWPSIWTRCCIVHGHQEGSVGLQIFSQFLVIPFKLGWTANTIIWSHVLFVSPSGLILLPLLGRPYPNQPDRKQKNMRWKYKFNRNS